MFEPVPPKDKRSRVLFISVLKALAVDVERNLRAPIVGVTRQAEELESAPSKSITAYAFYGTRR